jgi:putative nucleotidyltransferase with HDIG domain
VPTYNGKDDYVPEMNADTTVAQQIELAVGRLDSLSTLPCIAVQFFSKLLEPQFSLAVLADIVESDPALAAKILSLAHDQGVSLSDERFSLRRALDRLPADLVRDTILTVKVSGAFELGNGPDKPRILAKKDLMLHSLAVACCAKRIAEVVSVQVQPQLAYLAGLLHDIGKHALQEAMPKSFDSIVEEARSTKASSCTIEQKRLGAEHTVLGKGLSQRWHLPDAIGLAIWLHHSDTATICQSVPEARIAQVVQLADSIARQSGVGQSGSYDSPGAIAEMAQALRVELDELEQIRRGLPATVAEKSKVLGLDLPNAAARYCDIAHTAAAQFARKHSELSLENRQLQTASTHLDFTTDFVLSMNSGDTAIDIAEDFAVRWQRFYQTGMVCLYLVPPGSRELLEAVVIENLGQSRRVILSCPADSEPLPEKIRNSFAIMDARGNVDWLFEQVEIDSTEGRAKLLPLLADGKAVAAIVFELHYPADVELFEEKFRMTASIAGSILAMAFALQRQEHFAQRFVRLISKPKQAQPNILAGSPLDALAEMAAGVAHELNNPLSVISGRAQLLADAESDNEKKQSLNQIKQNARKVSAIIEDLMSFAEPRQPRPARTDIKQVLDEAIQLTSQKTNVENINVEIEVAQDVKNVLVDSAQIVSAIANVLCNCLESYIDKIGPIKITADTESDDIVRFQISDLGCGMDAETIKKATQPFFSSKPAGRKRGMGLAYAQRLVQLNKGSLEITSEPGSGTTVSILLRSA